MQRLHRHRNKRSAFGTARDARADVVTLVVAVQKGGRARQGEVLNPKPKPQNSNPKPKPNTLNPKVGKRWMLEATTGVAAVAGVY